MNPHERHPERADKSQNGSALLLAIFVLALLTAMGAALLFLSQNEVMMGEASIRPKKAFYFAEAGLEHARHQLWLDNNSDDFDNELLDATGLPVNPIDFDPETVAPVYDTNGNVVGFNGFGNDQPLIPFQAFEDGWYTAFLSNDLGEGRDDENDDDNRVIITGVGVGPDQSFEVVEAVIDIASFLPEFPPAAIFLIGPTPTFVSGSAAKKQYSGNDCGTTGGDYYPAVGTIGSAAEAAVEAGAGSGPTYETGPYSTAADTIADMSSSPVAGMSDATYTMDPEWQNCQAMVEMVEWLRTLADVTCADGTSLAKPSCPANPTNPEHIYFGEGDLNVSMHVHHYGMLVVTGTLALSGAIDFDGIILVVGEGHLTSAGAGNGTVNGSVIVANIAGPDGVYGNADDCTGGPNGFMPSIYDQSGGGNSDSIFCSAAIKDADQAKPYEIMEFRQY